MNKKIFFAFLFLFILCLVGCEKPSDPNDGETANKFDEQVSTISSFLNENIPYIITEDIELISEYQEYNAMISWESSDEDLIDSYGFVTPNRTKAKEVTLTYTINIEDYEESGEIEVVVSPVTIEKVAERFESQFSKIITRDYNVTSKYYDLFTIDWASSNTTVFDDEGCYHKQIDDVDFKIYYNILCGKYTSEQKSISLTAVGVSDEEKIEEINKWIQEEALKDLYINEDVTLPTFYEKYNVNINWTSSNTDVISNKGEIKHFVFERYVTLICSYNLENGSGGKTKFECIVSPLDTSKMSEKEILENFVSAIAVENYSQVSFGYPECPILSQSYGSLNFYENKDADIKQLLIPIGTSNRSQKPMVPQLVVVHDTANYNAGAEANAKYVQSGYSNTSTSWHYTTGNDGIFQTLPDNECGAHANGNNTTPFELVDTGIKATALKPKVTIGDDHYIYINGIKTEFILPDTSRKFADDGVICEIGSNGNYHISKIWYCSSHGYNANLGGNASGIGIESAVKSGDDYMMTVRKTAKLVAELLIKHDLTINRVVQHNTMSGKNCPQAIREANYWYTFKDMVSLEKWAKENLGSYEIVWTSNCDLLNNSGYISKSATNKDTIYYSVSISKNGTQVYGSSFSTKLM